MKNAVVARKILVFLAAALPLLLCSCKEPAEERPPKPTADITDVAEPVREPGWITFKPEARINPRMLFTEHAAIFHLPAGNEMVAQSEEIDELGLTHFRFQQFFNKIEVENAEFLVRARDGVALSANGRLAHDFQPETTTPQIPEEQAWRLVQERIPAERYFREDNFLSDFENQDAAPERESYRPKGKLLFTQDPKSPAAERRLVWMFKVYVAPLDRSRQIYLDTRDGSLVKELPLFPSCHLGSGPVTFRGTRSMNTQRQGDRFRLNDDCDGNLLSAVLLDAASKRVDISDDDNNWAGNNPSVVTSYWGLRACYDYFQLLHGRRSYDGKNGNMTIFNDTNMQDAGHNATGGSGGIRIGLANAGNDNDDYNTLDIIGHEFTHNVIEQSAKLAYDVTQESAALNESFCDIFGQAVEQWIEGEVQKEWVIADDKGCASPYICRDLKNPKATGGPDTYKGANFQTPCVDPHVNGGVQNRWFALLCDGGTGTNTELGTDYNVSGIGMAKGRKIAYRTLTRYLTADSSYVDARNGSMTAATDLFGVDSREVGEVTKAWCAVGLCPYGVPKQPDKFDQPGGNPNPASPNNNNTLAGATPLGTGSQVLGVGSYPWSFGTRPTLRVSQLSIYPFNELDYFHITFPQVDALGGRCATSGFAFNFGTPVNARIFFNGALFKSFVNAAYFSLPLEPSGAGNFVLEISAPFPGQILDYNLQISFYLHFRSDCFQPNLPNKLEQLRDCPMCDLKILSGIDQVILEPLYRRPDIVAIQDHYFNWNGEGPLNVPVHILQGNNLHAELVNEAGEIVTAADAQGAGEMLLQAPQGRPGVYSLRFSGFGNSTEIIIRTPR